MIRLFKVKWEYPVAVIAAICGGSIWAQTHKTPIIASRVAPSVVEHVLSPSDIDVYQLYTLTNKARTDAGDLPLRLNPFLDNSAKAKCDDMVAKDYWAHKDPNGTEPWHFFTEQGIRYNQFGENLAFGEHSAQQTTDEWMASPEHKSAILNPAYTDVGFTVCESEHFTQAENQPTLIVVQHFAQL